MLCLGFISLIMEKHGHVSLQKIQNFKESSLLLSFLFDVIGYVFILQYYFIQSFAYVRTCNACIWRSGIQGVVSSGDSLTLSCELQSLNLGY